MNNSLDYEFEFIHYFEGKTYGQLSEKWKKHLKRIFPNIEHDTIIHCSKHENYMAKGDVDLRIKGAKVIISLKNGKNACMHRERFTWLYKDFKNLGLSRNTLNVITLYHFGECKAFGHLDKPLTKEEIVSQYGSLIYEANKELNKEEIIDFIIERAVVKGRQDYRQRIDYFYYGNLKKGLLISVDQIYESIKSRKELSSSWLHFGQLVYQPGARNRDTRDYLETTIRWPVLSKLFFVAEDEDDILKVNIDKEN